MLWKRSFYTTTVSMPNPSAFFRLDTRAASSLVLPALNAIPKKNINIENTKRSLYYYSNALLQSASTGFVGQKDFTKQNLLFVPNYRIANLSPHKLMSTVAVSGSESSCSPTVAANNTGSISSTHSNKESVIKKVAKSALACHPPKPDLSVQSSKSTTSASSHIPFEVKAKETREHGSIFQQISRGEKKTLKQITDPYLALTKPQLTFLIMLSSICSYALAPNSTNVVEFIALTTGTLLASGAANAINMAREPTFDKQMVRTQARPVVKGLVTPIEAYCFAGLTGAIGCTILYFGVNPTVSALGALNIVLYSWLYTSLKRRSILNTWVGAIVGAIPPLMGWAACSSLSEPGAWCLAALLYAWQFPHFNSLSHNIKDEYKKAGYVMTAFKNPKLNARVSLRYSLAMFPICFGLAYYGVTDNFFVLDSSLLNGWMAYMSFRFWWQQRQNHSKAVMATGGPTREAVDLANFYAKKTFWCSIWQLPVVLVLAMLHKQGQWDRLFAFDEDVGVLQS